MSISKKVQDLQILYPRRSSIAKVWCNKVLNDGFKPSELLEIQQGFIILADQVVYLLLKEHFESYHAHSIGEALSCLRIVQPDILWESQEILQCLLLEDMPHHPIASFQLRLQRLFNEMARGFFNQSGVVHSSTEEQIHRFIYKCKRVEEDLRQNEIGARAMVEEATVGIALTDWQGRFIESNTMLQAMLGYSGEELGSKIFSEIIYPDDLAAHTVADEALVAREIGHYQIESRYLYKDGQIAYGRFTTSVIEGVQIISHVVEDITEQKRMEIELSKTRNQLYWIQEIERRRIARELHDDAIQQLLGISYKLMPYQKQRNTSEKSEIAASQDIVSEKEEIRQEILDVVKDLREVIKELRPTALGKFDLRSTLEGYIEDLRRKIGQKVTTIELALPRKLESLSSRLIFCLFRIVQEALRNALLHAQASYIAVHVIVQPEVVVLNVHDDGVGFPVLHNLPIATKTNHFGLAGIAERVEMINGLFMIDSRPGKGTKIKVYLPVSQEEHDEHSYPCIDC